MDQVDWAQLLEAIRAGRSQAALAADLGISQSLTSKLLRGVRQPGPRVIRGIIATRPELAEWVIRSYLGPWA
ncbi:MAG: helix-turn-helix domain-containing protein [Anaerolineae bacterium]|jgi:transcriptional regulator with XRE-family HTH domain